MPLGASGGGPYCYTGEHWDAATDLLYLRARWYDPATGRFLTRDPFPGLPVQPTTLHPYTYALNNPVLYVDPTGKFLFLPLLAVAAAGGLLGGLGYYGIQAYMQADPCTGMQWDWGQALFWGGVGTVMGAGIGVGIYGGWWVGVQLGWWGPTVGPTILWLEQQVTRVQHIMAPKHAWGRLIELSDDLLVNYRRAQPIIQQVVNSTEPEVKALSGGGRMLTYVGTVQGEQIVVIIYETAEGVRQISNAWVVTR